MDNACAICSRLKNEEHSFSKYAAPEYDTPLPEVSQLLKTIPGVRGEINEKDQVRVCPDCRQLYRYQVSYEYHVNGSEDEELLTRMTESEMAAFHKQRMRELEGLRREIDGLEGASGDRSDYIDHGNPDDEAEREAYADMERYTQMAGAGKELLKNQVDFLRQFYPMILMGWAEIHIKVCEKLRGSYDEQDIDGRVSVFEANETIKNWQAFLAGGVSYVKIYENWLEGYSALVDESLA